MGTRPRHLVIGFGLVVSVVSDIHFYGSAPLQGGEVRASQVQKCNFFEIQKARGLDIRGRTS